MAKGGAKRVTEQDTPSSPQSSPESKKPKNSPESEDVRFIGDSVPADEARAKWPQRYQSSKQVMVVTSSDKDESSEKEVLQARRHFTQAIVDGCVFNLNDDVYVQAGEGEPHFIAKIVELFESIDMGLYFTARWFYRAKDTVIKDKANLIDERRVFYSDVTDDNPLDCIVSKIKIAQLAANVEASKKEKAISSSDLYCDMNYSLPYFTFTARDTASYNPNQDSDESSIISSEGEMEIDEAKISKVSNCEESEMTLLDMYSGCGAMSTGLSLGASMSGLKLATRWAVDLNSHACESLKLNHPETQVRNEAAEDFLCLLKEWEKLCKDYRLLGSHHVEDVNSKENNSDGEEVEDVDDGNVVAPGEYEVAKLLAVCYGDPNNANKPGLFFKVRWKGYGPSEDTWEPIDGLSNCKDNLKEFVTKGHKGKILPLPGDVDCICGGPPCQGISGFNRFRNATDPLKDPKNYQLRVFMDTVEFLKPKYVLMENVCDILKFAECALGCYAIARLVSMDYQTRVGIMAAGSYGVPQCRYRVFLWGAISTEKLPRYPLPTHELVGRGVVVNEFKEIIVGPDQGQPCDLEKSILLGDAISDLPSVTNYEIQDEMLYGRAPCTDFQKYIRLKRKDLFDFTVAREKTSGKHMLYDHIPLQLNKDDYERVCRIPKRKGANFRDLPGVLVGPDKKVKLDPSMERILLASGKPLVPDYAITFVRGSSPKPFGRLWMDEIVTTVVTRAEPHNQVILHPNQDRVLTVRENARLQGFPDCYKLSGPVKERYIQVGNAVAFPVSIALGYTLAKAIQGVSGDEPLMTLPIKFPNCLSHLSSA